MRFTTDTWPEHQTYHDVFDDRSIAFARDLIFFVFRMYNKNWMPLGYKTYTINGLSPLTYRIREALRLLLKDTDPLYRAKYEKTVLDGTDEKLARYLHHARRVICNFYLEKVSSVNTLFDTLLYIARLSLEFHEEGTRDAPYMANILIIQVLDDMPPNVYQFFDIHAQNMIECESKYPHRTPST